jgi:membrane protein YdbS with pleckstrin-like domain
MEPRAAELLETGEQVIFDKRHSLWEIWKNLLTGAAAVVALVLLLTKFKPGPTDPGGARDGYLTLISVLAGFVLIAYGIWPLIRKRRAQGKARIIPILVAVLATAAWVVLFLLRNNPEFSAKWDILAWLGFFFVVLVWLVYPILKWVFTRFVLTDRRLIFSSGILSKKSKMIPLDQVNDITGSQNLWERIFHYGDVVIESAGEFGQERFTNITDPVRVRTEILQQRRLYEEVRSSLAGKEMAREVGEVLKQQPAAAGAQPGASRELELVEGLKKLDELRQSGALTEDEFQEAKRELMEKLRGQ